MSDIFKYLTSKALAYLLTIITLLSGVGLYAQNENEIEALKRLEAQRISYEENDEPLKLAQTLAKMGYIYAKIKDYDRAISAYKKSSSIYLQNKKLDDVRRDYSNIGFVYTESEEYDNALTYFNNALKVARLQGKEEPVAGCLTDVAYLLMVEKEYRVAIERLLEALEIANEIKNQPLIMKIYSMLMECYKALGMYAKFQEFQDKLNSFSNYIQKEDSRKKVAELEIKNKGQEERSDLAQKNYELQMMLAQKQKEMDKQAFDNQAMRQAKELQDQQEKQEQLRNINKAQLDLLRTSEENKNLAYENVRKNRMMLYGAGFALLLLLIIAYLLWRNMRKSRKLNDMLIANNKTIEDQKSQLEVWSMELAEAYEEVSIQKNSMSDSIRYAKHIQMSMLMNTELIKKDLPIMVFFKPRDVVSGDFYWYFKREERIYIAAIDCTGHGVPGAMISMIGNNILENIMNTSNFMHPNEIMNQMHLEIRRTLRQDTTDNHDGMDMALCMIDKMNKMVEYCGAKNALLIARPGQDVEKVKPDNFGIGGLVEEDVLSIDPLGRRHFTNHVFEAEPDATYYIFSDGYSDQFGGAKDKKYMLGKFRKLLERISQSPINEQEQLLEEELETWKGDMEQTDDILVIGFKAG